MRTCIYIALISLMLALESCYQELNFANSHTPTLVLNAIAHADSTVKASVTRTVNFTDSRQGFPVVDDADVALYVNGEFIETMQWKANADHNEDGLYHSTYRPKTGDVIKITAIHQSGQIWAEDKIPELVVIDSLDVTLNVIDNPGMTTSTGEPTKNHVYTYKIWFKDLPEQDNYYCIRIDDGNGNTHNLGVLDYSKEPVFANQSSIIDGVSDQHNIYGQGGRTFSDDMFQDKQYCLTIQESETAYYYQYAKALPRRIMLYSVSESYYKYLTGVINAAEQTTTNKLIDFGFIEPTIQYSNVHHGTGILGCFQLHYKTTDLTNLK